MARDIAIQSNTSIVVEDNDGNIVHIDAEPLRRERDEQEAKRRFNEDVVRRAAAPSL